MPLIDRAFANTQMKMPSDNQITRELEPYGFTPDSEMSARIRVYVSLLLKWNKTISLTTVTEIDQILRFHFGESLLAVPMLPVEKSRLADVGSGAGFPGIPLAMARPELAVTLIEPNLKKFAFLSEVSRELELTNVTAVRSRMEDLESSESEFDVITARALGQFQAILEWSGPKLIHRTGKLILWLGENDVSRIQQEKGWEWGTPTAIPGSERRFILSGAPDSYRR
jgi:16S rRNA (guanine527-N7)-methyltransferase